MDRYCFLDIDGVVAHHMMYYFGHKGSFIGTNVCDPLRLNLLERWIRENHIQTIICSTWRKKFGYNAEAMNDWFKLHYNVDLNIVDCTGPNLESRGLEVREVIVKREIKSYVIIDDSDDYMIEQLDQFVKVNHLNGLLFTDLIRASLILGVTDSFTSYANANMVTLNG